MITIKLRGGLGNQLFQYAFGRSVAKKLGVDLGLDPHYYEDHRYALGNTARRYTLDKFNIKGVVISEEEHKKINSPLKRVVRKIGRKIFPENPWIYNQKYKNVKDGSYLIGYWQSEKYFKDVEAEIRNELTPSLPLGKEALVIKEKITNTKNTVSVSIRRTDYLNQEMFNGAICTEEYYEKGLKYIAEHVGVAISELTAFVNSDDIEWVKNNLKLPCPTVFISSSEITDYETLHLISYTEHNIIANSTFSWWGAWLNNNTKKIVVAPKLWTSLKIPTPDIIPDTWIRI